MRLLRLMLKVLLLLVLGVLMLTGCREKNPEKERVLQADEILIYGTDAAGKVLVEMTANANLKGMSTEEKVGYLLQLLEEAGDAETVFPVLPKGIIEKVEITVPEETRLPRAEITLNESYLKMDPVQRALCKAGIAGVLLEHAALEGIDLKVQDTVIDTMEAGKIMLPNNDAGNLYNETIRATLYFADEERQKLLAEQRELELSMTDTLPMAVMQALIEGPAKEDHRPLMPNGTRVNDISVEDGICYVDLSSEFQINHEGTEILEMLTIYSVVDSLSNVNGIEAVQILIDGQRVDTFKGYIALDHFLERNSEIIGD